MDSVNRDMNEYLQMRFQTLHKVLVQLHPLASTAMYAGGGASAVALLMSIDWLAVIGVVLAIAGFIANQRYQRKKNKREEFESQARMKRDQEIHELKLKKLKEENCNVKD